MSNPPSPQKRGPDTCCTMSTHLPRLSAQSAGGNRRSRRNYVLHQQGMSPSTDPMLRFGLQSPHKKSLTLVAPLPIRLPARWITCKIYVEIERCPGKVVLPSRRADRSRIPREEQTVALFAAAPIALRHRKPPLGLNRNFHFGILGAVQHTPNRIRSYFFPRPFHAERLRRPTKEPVASLPGTGKPGAAFR